MKTKIVYSIVGCEKNFYVEQAYMSVRSLRIHNTECRVELVVDPSTYFFMKSQKYNLVQCVDEIHVIEPPAGYTMKQISRYLKTTIRNVIEGDFLFIDTDTIITSSISEIDNMNFDVAAVASAHDALYVSMSDEWIISNAKKVGWNDIVGLPHFNSGVFLVKDTEKSRALYNRWHELWNECRLKGSDIDQLPLTKANRDCGYVIQELPGEWNAQILRPAGLHLMPTAKIVHYFASNDCPFFILGQQETFLRIRREGTIPEDLLSYVNNPCAAMVQNSKIIYGNDMDFYYSSLHDVFVYYRSCYKFLNCLAKWYLTVRGKIGTLKTNILR